MNIEKLIHLSDCRIWDFLDGPYGGLLEKNEGVDFTGSNFNIFILDLFQGKLPHILCEKYVKNKKLDIKFIPSLILDSNIVAYLNQFILKKLNAGMNAVVLKFFIIYNT